jgi:hypothetical protein
MLASEQFKTQGGMSNPFIAWVDCLPLSRLIAES